MGRKSGLDKAADEVTQRQEQVARWTAEAETARAELADLEARAGGEVLDDETAAERLTASLSALRSRVDVAERAASAAASRLNDARRSVLQVRAEFLREEARALRAAADQRQAKTDRLLAELSEWEGGARYIPWEPTERDVLARGPQEFTVPKTQAMRNRAAALDRQAGELERQAAQDTASVERNAARVLATVTTG